MRRRHRQQVNSLDCGRIGRAVSEPGDLATSPAWLQDCPLPKEMCTWPASPEPNQDPTSTGASPESALRLKGLQLMRGEKREGREEEKKR